MSLESRFGECGSVGNRWRRQKDVYPKNLSRRLEWGNSVDEMVCPPTLNECMTALWVWRFERRWVADKIENYLKTHPGALNSKREISSVESVALNSEKTGAGISRLFKWQKRGGLRLPLWSSLDQQSALMMPLRKGIKGARALRALYSDSCARSFRTPYLSGFLTLFFMFFHSKCCILLHHPPIGVDFRPSSHLEPTYSALSALPRPIGHSIPPM